MINQVVNINDKFKHVDVIIMLMFLIWFMSTLSQNFNFVNIIIKLNTLTLTSNFDFDNIIIKFKHVNTIIMLMFSIWFMSTLTSNSNFDKPNCQH